MKLIRCVQNSTEWLNARAGLPTASNFAKILTPTGKVSSQAERYMHHLIAERLLGRPLEMWSGNEDTENGKLRESEAVAFYELQRNVDTIPCGFMTTDDGKIGASPDRLVGDDGLLEVKCPKEATHIGYMLGGGVDDAYKPQTQGQLYVSERAHLDIVSYCPGLASVIIRVNRDDKFIADLAKLLKTFCEQMEERISRLTKEEQGHA